MNNENTMNKQFSTEKNTMNFNENSNNIPTFSPLGLPKVERVQ